MWKRNRGDYDFNTIAGLHDEILTGYSGTKKYKPKYYIDKCNINKLSVWVGVCSIDQFDLMVRVLGFGLGLDIRLQNLILGIKLYNIML